MDNKSVLLTFIKERKEVLFGKFSDILSHEDKKAAWKEVCIKGQSLAIIPKDKDWKYARDSTFANWKQRTLAKKDNSKKTGASGGSKAKLTQMDQLILDIIGKDSPLIDGLRVPESGVESEIILDSSYVFDQSELMFEDTSVNQPTSSNKRFQTPSRPNPSETAKRPKDICRQSDYHAAKEKRKLRIQEEDELKSQKRRKLDLQVDILEIEKRRKCLEVLKLERELGVSSSRFTSSLLTNPASQTYDDSDWN